LNEQGRLRLIDEIHPIRAAEAKGISNTNTDSPLAGHVASKRHDWP
jgi:hypothetical protein